jgi:hypothetical protein
MRQKDQHELWEIQAILDQLLTTGDVEIVGVRQTGEPVYGLTDLGHARLAKAKGMLH